MDAILQIRDVHKYYSTGAEPVHALRGVSLDVPQGQFAAIMGSSGSGKSTLLHLSGGLDPVDEGHIVIEGRDITSMSDHNRTVFRRRRLGVVFQAYNLLPTLTARENVGLPLLVDRAPMAEIQSKTDRLLDLFELTHRADHRPDAMSGGEQQRVAIARALMNDPAVILADEPTGNLDSANAEKIWELLRTLVREQGTTVLMVTHEAAGASYADVVHVLRDGQLIGSIDSGGQVDTQHVAGEYLRINTSQATAGDQVGVGEAGD
ncbi:MAG: ABC transporter ATP-binding protein [Phycisphaerae bacterium]|nr:ABC transporter ATP-binding protein [Phycisphaerae bacterium]